MTVSQLSLYNSALRILGERKLASLVEERLPRRVLDDIWDDGNGGAINHCLEQGLWKFAIRSQAYTYNPSITPDFGLAYAFNKPDDWLRTAAVATDPYFNNPLTQYADENGYWFADWQTLYIKYVSSDDQFGNDMSLWPQSFIKFVEGYLAYYAAPQICEDEKKEEKAKKIMNEARLAAKSKDAMDGPAEFMPQGAWAGSRFGRYTRRNRDYGG